MIDYERMKRVRPGQKRALTLAVKSGDAKRIVDTCKAAVKEWNAIGGWPDDWSRWQRALNDISTYHRFIDLEQL